MKVKWLGHACFLLTSEAGVRILTDPYTPGAFGLGYRPPAETADIVTVSHDHADHDNTAAVQGKPEVVSGAGVHKVTGVEINGISTSHDETSGSQRGPNTVFCFTLDGVRVCHLGDLGHDLAAGELAEIGPVDLLMIPVGGNFTIDAEVASRVADRIAAKIVIPMHFQNERCREFPVAGVDDFRKKRQRVRTADGSEVEITKDGLPKETETVVLKPAC